MLELLIVLLVLGLFLALGGPSLMAYINQQRLQDDAYAAANTFKYAVSEVRRQNTPVTLTINGQTLTVARGTTTLKTVTMRSNTTLNCPAACPTSNQFTLSAPFGRNNTDFSLTFTINNSSKKRVLLVRGPLGLVSVQ